MSSFLTPSMMVECAFLELIHGAPVDMQPFFHSFKNRHDAVVIWNSYEQTLQNITVGWGDQHFRDQLVIERKELEIMYASAFETTPVPLPGQTHPLNVPTMENVHFVTLLCIGDMVMENMEHLADQFRILEKTVISLFANPLFVVAAFPYYIYCRNALERLTHQLHVIPIDIITVNVRDYQFFYYLASACSSFLRFDLGYCQTQIKTAFKLVLPTDVFRQKQMFVLLHLLAAYVSCIQYDLVGAQYRITTVHSLLECVRPLSIGPTSCRCLSVTAQFIKCLCICYETSSAGRMFWSIPRGKRTHDETAWINYYETVKLVVRLPTQEALKEMLSVFKNWFRVNFRSRPLLMFQLLFMYADATRLNPVGLTIVLEQAERLSVHMKFDHIPAIAFEIKIRKLFAQLIVDGDSEKIDPVVADMIQMIRDNYKSTQSCRTLPLLDHISDNTSYTGDLHQLDTLRTYRYLMQDQFYTLPARCRVEAIVELAVARLLLGRYDSALLYLQKAPVILKSLGETSHELNFIVFLVRHIVMLSGRHPSAVFFDSELSKFDLDDAALDRVLKFIKNLIDEFLHISRLVLSDPFLPLETFVRMNKLQLVSVPICISVMSSVAKKRVHGTYAPIQSLASVQETLKILESANIPTKSLVGHTFKPHSQKRKGVPIRSVFKRPKTTSV